MGVLLWIHPACGSALEAEIIRLDVGEVSGAMTPDDGVPGRGGIGNIFIMGQRLLFKRERRGGLSSRFMPDLYFNREPFLRELSLSLMMEAKGLAPRIIARWFLATAGAAEVFTLMQPLENAVSLMEILSSGGQGTTHLKAAGELVGRLHALGVYHGDLNAGNVLIDGSGRPWGIDWRHSSIFTPFPDELRLANLRRLERSIVKTLSQTGARLGQDGWEALAMGYREGGGFGGEPVTKQWLKSAGRGFFIRRFFWERFKNSGRPLFPPWKN
ncbi:MAG: hypothetical protein JHC34_03415 [Acidobacteria bacterium]|nr:hypothetical protein [Acidobacteriota bacterium]